MFRLKFWTHDMFMDGWGKPKEGGSSFGGLMVLCRFKMGEASLKRLFSTMVFIFTVLSSIVIGASGGDQSGLPSALGKGILNKGEIVLDMSLLSYILKEGYVGFHINDQHINSQLLRSIDKLLLKKHISPCNMARALNAAFAVYPDGHLSASLAKNGGQGCDAQGRYIPAVGSNVASGVDGNWAMRFVNVGGERIPVVGITSQPSGESPLWRGFVDLAKALRRFPAIIYDLRGNDGGWSGKVIEHLTYLRKTPLTLPYDEVSLDTAAARSVKRNGNLLDLYRSRHGNCLVGRERCADVFTNSEKNSGYVLTRDRSQAGYGGKWRRDYPGLVVVLLDSGCESSCEHSLEFFQQMPRVVFVGQNSGGAIHYADVGRIVLPESGITVFVATTYYDYHDGRGLEREGYPPDVRVRSGNDALESAVRYLEDNNISQPDLH